MQQGAIQNLISDKEANFRYLSHFTRYIFLCHYRDKSILKIDDLYPKNHKHFLQITYCIHAKFWLVSGLTVKVIISQEIRYD